ncbi:MAG: CoA transferase [Gemmatimonadetes bacterium]|nr:CoA transferase [Gemmatimonadota bacterium]
MTSSLDGIRVCDLTQNLAGPLCAQILGDLGAEIIKVEAPGGDPGRAWGPPFWGSDSTLFLSANRNKRSIILDLKNPEAREILYRLAKESDVLVQSARFGVPERLGYDYESIKAIRDDIIYMSVSAYGDRGPMREFPGYDPLMQAFSGIMSVTGHPGGPPARVGGSVVDYGTGMWATIAILSALRTRDATGRGAKLDAALLDTAVGWVSYHLSGYFATGDVPGPMGSAMDSIVPYQGFQTADGSVMISGGSDLIFVRLCNALGLGELGEDPRFLTNPDRVANRVELIEILEDQIKNHATEDLLELMHDHAVPCSPIQNMAEVAAHPQVVEAGLLPMADHPAISNYQDVALPLRVDGERPRGDRPPPAAGEHTSEILGELGYGEEEVRGFLERGVAFESS